MKSVISTLSLLVLLFLFSITVCAEPYGGYQWVPAETEALGPPPRLLANEKVAPGSGMLSVNGRVIWVTVIQDGEQKATGFLSWDSRQGTMERISSWQYGRVVGLAYNAVTNELLIRTTDSMHMADPRTFAVKRTVTFSKARVWHDMAVAGDELVVLGGNGRDIHLYDLQTFALSRTVTPGVEKIQRLSPFSAGQIVLGSSYWGASLRLFDIKAGTVSVGYRVHGSNGYRGFYRLVQLADKRHGLLDPFGSGAMEQLAFTGTSFVTLNNGGQITKNGLGWRIRPRLQQLEGLLTLAPGVDMPATELVLVLPVPSMYHQELSDESFPQGGQVITDSLGNRMLKLALPPLKAGEHYSRLYYSARLTRYQAFFNLSGLVAPVTAPPEWKTYLADHKVYDLEHPQIAKTLQEVAPAGSSPAATVQSVYRFAVGIPYGKGFEPAPAAIVKGSGGCTEHSYIQVALLRKAGIPARFVWNSIGDRNGEAQFDHKYAEAWLPDTGWVPLEPLAGTREYAGYLTNYPLIFGVMDGPRREQITAGDSLVSYTKAYAKFWKIAKPSVVWKVGEGRSTR